LEPYYCVIVYHSNVFDEIFTPRQLYSIWNTFKV